MGRQSASVLLVTTCTTRMQPKPNPDNKTQQAEPTCWKLLCIATSQQQLIEIKQTMSLVVWEKVIEQVNIKPSLTMDTWMVN